MDALARILAEPAYRPKIARQLSKGESIHSPAAQLHHAREAVPTVASSNKQANGCHT
ncbi:hypothetical protein [Streptomyces coffeae]|uniref:Uncharacterized protein n=1 Tax=Streptomyces coffeae TaxID=621382 RepID=A0ABS1NP81_9ACTN|nr:hypothetical protein [Streptomyces coffeae]MBL1101818.1 hypothetical protein [Streptomyces coffeae]